MPKIDLKNVSLNYELSGVAGAPVLMLSNSLGTDLRMWEPQVKAFEARYRLLRYDMRGHGLSSVPAGPYTISDLGDDVLGLLDALGMERVNFCGLSIGGVIGQWLGVHASERLDRLILANTAAKIGTAETWNDRIDAVRKRGMAAIADSGMQRWFTPDFLAAGGAEVVRMRETLLATNPEGYIASCEAIREMDQREAVGGIRVPVCIIAGDRDPVTTVADAEFLKSRIHGAQLKVLHAAHISNVEAAEAFNVACVDFLG